MISGAPTEVLNPGLFENVCAHLSIPFTTALHACVSGLRACSAKRVLLLTPFDRPMNEMICVYLKERGISARAPHPFDNLALPKSMDPDQVFELTRQKLDPVDPVDAVYFQGAVLDPIKILQRIETELGTTAVASNPAMLWHLLSILRLPHPIAGYGRLLREWPKTLNP
jgi:maleate cis-trans isomerase